MSLDYNKTRDITFFTENMKWTYEKIYKTLLSLRSMEFTAIQDLSILKITKPDIFLFSKLLKDLNS